MSLWLVRAGKFGEHEEVFFSSNRICLTWEEVFGDRDPTPLKTYDEVWSLVDELYPENSKSKRANTSAQFSAFLITMKVGDWVVTPRKAKSAIAIGEVESTPIYDPKAPDPYHVYRRVKWLNQEVPRSAFEQDLLYSFGAIQTICQIQRNDAEARIRAMAREGWRTKPSARIATESMPSDDRVEEMRPIDLEQAASDQLAELIVRKFKGHALAHVVGSILAAQGYQTHVSPEGADKGVDILAAPGPLGFGTPRLCVQVKSGEGPVDRMTLDQLIGAMQNFHAEQGLLVSWSGFKSSVDRERAAQFFRVRLWDSEELVKQLLEQYDRLPAELRSELPLKRIWVLASSDEN